jgi:hypothetical protein
MKRSAVSRHRTSIDDIAPSMREKISCDGTGIPRISKTATSMSARRQPARYFQKILFFYFLNQLVMSRARNARAENAFEAPG